MQNRLVHIKSGDIVPPQYSNALSAWILVRVFNIQTRKIQPFAEVKQQIARDLATARSKSDTKKFAQNWLERRGSSISVAEDDKIMKVSKSRLTISDSFLDSGIENIFLMPSIIIRITSGPQVMN